MSKIKFTNSGRNISGNQSSSSNNSTGRSNIDFSALSQSMADIKRGLWDFDRRNNYFQKKLTQQHSNFANKVIITKKDEAFNSYCDEVTPR